MSLVRDPRAKERKIDWEIERKIETPGENGGERERRTDGEYKEERNKESTAMKNILKDHYWKSI